MRMVLLFSYMHCRRAFRVSCICGILSGCCELLHHDYVLYCRPRYGLMCNGRGSGEPQRGWTCGLCRAGVACVSACTRTLPSYSECLQSATKRKLVVYNATEKGREGTRRAIPDDTRWGVGAHRMHFFLMGLTTPPRPTFTERGGSPSSRRLCLKIRQCKVLSPMTLHDKLHEKLHDMLMCCTISCMLCCTLCCMTAAWYAPRYAPWYGPQYAARYAA